MDPDLRGPKTCGFGFGTLSQTYTLQFPAASKCGILKKTVTVQYLSGELATGYGENLCHRLGHKGVHHSHRGQVVVQRAAQGDRHF